MSPAPVTLRFRLEEDDQVQAARWLLLHDPRVRVLHGLTLVFVLFVPLLFMHTAGGVALGMAAGLLLFGAFVAALAVSAGRAGRRAVRALPDERRDREYGFTGDALLVGDAKAVARIPWEEVRRAEETAVSFLLWTAVTDVHLIPKRAAASEEALAQVRAWLAEKVPKARLRG